ncbi:MAG: TIR domain-containing protein [Sphingomicrobium sp.]
MNEPEPASDHDDRVLRPVFVSYATKDRKQALSVCDSIEGRGTPCWISTRDVAPGENYQEAIVRSIRNARAMVLVFSKAANNSDEIKKELSLASRYRVPVMALRIEDVEPSDAFAYELSTRQWIDAFDGWDRSIDSLVSHIGQLQGAPAVAATAPSSPRRRPVFTSRRSMALATVAGMLLLGLAVVAWWLRPSPSAAHSMTVRLSGFKLLSTDLPETIPDTVDAEIAAAFNADGVIGVSTAASPATGSAPAYALGGTIQRDGDTIRVITRLTNERSGATLWSDNFDYVATEVSKVPRHIAVDAGNVVRCGLFGVSTYRKPLPDNVFRDYMQFCQGHWDPLMDEGRKALVPAQRVVAAVPDFSWGWAAVAGAYWKVAMSAENSRLADEARASGREAADRAVKIDGNNSEALYIKSMLVDRHDWIGRERLLKRAVGARRLDCGCEHHQYGWMLANVGRLADAVDQLRQANDMLALYVYTPLSLADALVAAGKADEAKSHYDAAIALAPNSGFADYLAAEAAADTGDLNRLIDPKLPIPADVRAALLKGYRAVASRDAGVKAQAIRALLALPDEKQDDVVARLLGALGANHEALRVATRVATQEYPGPSLFWYPGMRGSLNDPDFPVVAERFGLMKYWRTTHAIPDVCREKVPPPFCRMV